MEDKLSLPEMLIGSIAKIKSYRYFLAKPLSKAILYLLFVSLLFSGLNSLKNVILYSQAVNEIMHSFANEVPDFELRDGRLWVEGEMPLILEQTEDSIFVVDTSGELDRGILEGYDDGIFISEHEIVSKSGFETTIYNFSDFAGLRVTKNTVQNLLPLLRWISVFIVVFSFVFYFVGKLLSALMVAVAGLIVEAMVKHQVGFGNLFKLSIYALTLPMVLQLALNLTGITVQSFWMIYYGIALVYIWKALQMLRKDSETDQSDEPVIEG